MGMSKFFVLICVVLLAVPVQASASAVVKIVSDKARLLQDLVGLACVKSSVPVMPGKVNVIKCAYMVS